MHIMKKKVIVATITTALMTLSISQVRAVDAPGGSTVGNVFGQSTGQIIATGRVVSTPCELDNPATMNIDLGHNISLENLATTGHSTYQPVVIKLKSCVLNTNAGLTNLPATVSSATITFSGTRESGEGSNTDLYVNEATDHPAAHVGVGMYNMQHQLIKATDKGTVFPLTPETTADTLNMSFLIAAVHDGAGVSNITPGNVQSTINYTVSYK